MSVFPDFWPDFLCGCTTNQSKRSSVKGQFSIIHLVRTVCEPTFSIIQMYYTRTTLFCLHLRKSFLIEDHRTLYPKTMYHVCFCWCRRILSWMVVVWSEFVSLISCIFPPLYRFRAATYHRQSSNPPWWPTSVTFLCKVNVQWLNKLCGPIRTDRILQLQKWLEICKCQWTITAHQHFVIGFTGNELAFVHVTISILSGNSVHILRNMGIHPYCWPISVLTRSNTSRQVCTFPMKQI